MSEAIPRAVVERAVAAHDRLITALYGGELRRTAGARLTFNPWIEEPEWNHAGGVASANDEGLAGELAEIEAFFWQRNRQPAIVLDLATRPADLERRLAARGWREAFRHAGLIFPADREVRAIEWPAAAAVSEAGSSPATALAAEPGSFPGMDVFASVFAASFAETADGALSSGYHEAFPAAMKRPVAGVEVAHSLVTIDGEAAAVGSRALVDGVAGLYNLGVAPRFRRLGLGGALTLHRVAAARAAGAEVIYLLTEDPRVEAAQVRRGFVAAFELAGWVAGEAGEPG